jgi:hypothetical protein
MKAVRIDVYGALTEEDLPTGEGAGFNRAVGELVQAEAIERLAITSCWEIWADEDGIAKQLPPNPAATALAHHYGFAVTLYGTAVVTGVDHDTDTTVPLTPEQIDTIRDRLCDQHRASRPPTPSADTLADAVRRHADGVYCLQAAAEMLIAQHWLQRADFTHRFVTLHNSLTSGRQVAIIDWPTVIAALDTGTLPCSGGERRMLRLTASLAEGVPVDLNEALTGIDRHHAQLVADAVLRATGPAPLTRGPAQVSPKPTLSGS